MATACLLLIGAAGCSRDESAKSSSGSEPTLLRIGYQKSSSLLNILRTRQALEKRFGDSVQVVWQQFSAGPQMLEALNVGSVDFGTTGEAPPIFAQAAGAPLLYVALERVGPQAEVILVRPDSKYQSVKDLKGKRVALNKGSNVHYFLVRALESVGLEYKDIDPVFLPPADARAAFESGRVEAWLIWDPFAAAALEAGQARVLIDGKGLVENYQYYLSTRKLAEQHPEIVEGLIAELRVANDWAEGHRDEAAAFLASLLELDPHVLRVAEARRDYGIELIDPKIVVYQQQVADTFYKLGLIPNPVQVADVVWTRK